MGRSPVAANLMNFFGRESNRTLVSLPANGDPGVLAFDDRRLFAVLVLEAPGGALIDHVHVIADPGKLAFVASLLAE